MNTSSWHVRRGGVEVGFWSEIAQTDGVDVMVDIAQARAEALQTPTYRPSFALVLILLFSFFGIASMPDVATRYLRVSDSNLIADSSWMPLDLARYSEGHAIFAKKPGSSLSAKWPDPQTFSRVDVRLFDYGKGQSTIEVVAAGATTPLTIDGQRTGMNTLSALLETPVTTDAVELRVTSLGQAAVVIDSLTLVQPSHWDFARARVRGAVGASLGLALWLAVLFVRVPATSSGRLYTGIDIFRGIGALLVVLLHGTGYAGLPDLTAQPLLSRISGNGYFGVEIFYVVSAFTLTVSLFSALRKKQAHRVSTFWSRRVVRIIPTFAFVVIAALLLQNFLQSRMEGQNPFVVFWQFMTMGYVFDPATLRAPIGHMVWWSISTEFQFYILMPLLFFPLCALVLDPSLPDRPRLRAGVSAALVVAGIVLAACSRQVLADKIWLNYTIFFHLDAFFIGIALAFLTVRTDNKGHVGPALSPMVWKVLGIAAFAMLLGAVAFSYRLGQVLNLPEVFRPQRLVVIVACAGALFLVQLSERRGARFTGLGWLRTMGLLSFIVYLVHVPVLQSVTRLPVPSAVGTDPDYYWWIVGLGLSLTLLISLMVHRLVEHPALRLNVISESHPAVRGAVICFVLIVIFVLLLQLALG